MSHADRMASLIRTAAGEARASAMPTPVFSQYRRYADEGDRLGYEELYFRRRRHVTALAAEALIDPGADPAALQDALWSVCDEYSWALPAHEKQAVDMGRGMDQCLDLFAALTACLLAETVQQCGERLDPRVTDRVRAEVEHRVLTLLADDERPLPWESWPHNWAAVCGGAAGMAGIALWERGPRLDRLLDRCRRAMRTYLSGFGDDGGCAEGVGYWAFGFAHFVYFAEELRRLTGEDLLDDPKVRAIASFPAVVHLGEGLFPAFSDGQERPDLPAGLGCFLTTRLGVEVPGLAPVTEMPGDWADVTRTLRWGTLPATHGANRSRTGTSWLPDLAWVVDRGESSAFAAKGGHNDEPHNHNDLGHFLLAAGGEVLLTDLGAGEYRKGYFDDDTRYTFLHNSSEGHSVPVIASRGQSAGRRRAARVLRCEPGPDGVDYELDLTAAYEADGLRSLRRRFSWRRTPGELLLTDEVRAEHELTVDEVFVSRIEPRWEGSHAVWEGKTARARLAVPRQCVARDVETLHTTDHDGAPDTVHRLRVRFTVPAGTTSLRFTCTLQGR
ncbi:heparinase II/III family protein [Streptomyces sp. NPDC030592]|uniref:heparinase II/III domain-containing protein n=1 Tax=Streptomyces TaxID=1883 RepID=UPI0018D6429C|nr:heparinase II/III family protein [Streptomyces sp. HB-N217]MBH5131850.1 heparinase II/III family protein [Streptomyces sp. HB-N217]